MSDKPRSPVGWASQAAGRIYDRLPYKQPILSVLRPCGLPHSIYKHLHFVGEFEVATPRRSFRMIHHGYDIENELYWEGLPGRRERVSMDLWMKLSLTADVILDVGANTGVYSLVAGAMNPQARVYGFEPVQDLFEKYERNCRLNGFDIQPCRTALSNRIGTGVMRGWILDGSENGEGEPVPTSRLDSLIEGYGIRRIDLMKVDVEGHELQVLEGMGPFLRRWKPTLLIEVLSNAAGEKLERALAELNYLYFDLDEVGPPRSCAEIRKSSHWNYLVCQPAVALGLGLSRA